MDFHAQNVKNILFFMMAFSKEISLNSILLPVLPLKYPTNQYFVTRFALHSHLSSPNLRFKASITIAFFKSLEAKTYWHKVQGALENIYNVDILSAIFFTGIKFVILFKSMHELGTISLQRWCPEDGWLKYTPLIFSNINDFGPLSGMFRLERIA